MASTAECKRQSRWEWPTSCSASLVPSSRTLHYSRESIISFVTSGEPRFANEQSCRNQPQQYTQQLRIGTTHTYEGVKRLPEVRRLGMEAVLSAHELPQSGICKFQTKQMSGILPQNDHKPLPKIAMHRPPMMRDPHFSPKQQPQETTLTLKQIMLVSGCQPSTASCCAQKCRLSPEVVSPLPCAAQQHVEQQQQQQHKQLLQACATPSYDSIGKQFEAKAISKECAIPGKALVCAVGETAPYGCNIQTNMLSRSLPKSKSDALPRIPDSRHNDVHDPSAPIHERQACGVPLMSGKDVTVSRVQSSAAFKDVPLSLLVKQLVAAGFETGARGSRTRRFTPASFKHPGTTATTGASDVTPSDCRLSKLLRRCKGKRSPSHDSRDHVSTTNATKDGETQASLPQSAMVYDSVSEGSTGFESGHDLTCSSNEERKDEEEDEIEQLIALRQGMTRLNATLGQERGDAYHELRLQAFASSPGLAVLERGLEALEQLKNTS